MRQHVIYHLRNDRIGQIMAHVCIDLKLRILNRLRGMFSMFHAQQLIIRAVQDQSRRGDLLSLLHI